MESQNTRLNTLTPIEHTLNKSIGHNTGGAPAE